MGAARRPPLPFAAGGSYNGRRKEAVMRAVGLLLLTMTILSCCASTRGVYSIAQVPDITEVGDKAYWEWFERNAVSDETDAFIEKHRPAVEAVREKLVTLTADIEGGGIEGRTNPKDPAKPGLKKPHKVEEKIFRMLVESNEDWAAFDAGRSTNKGLFPRNAGPAEARKLAFSARPRDDFALRDIAALRVIVSTIRDIREVEDRIRERWKGGIVRYKDYLGKDYKENGYRSVHLVVVEGAQGRPVEIQVRTWSQHRWADWEHDLVYKGSFKKNPVAKAYVKEVAERLYEQETGTCEPPCELPRCPEVLLEAGKCFE